MQVRTIFLYLIGNRQAILDIAADRRWLGIGALFVLSAGLAREYDQEDLLHEWWYLLIPFGASLLTSLVLYSLISLAARKQRDHRTYWANYSRFLGLYWMTAPLAWLYAIPYERFLDLTGAMIANLITLAFVAAWRVGLMCRVVSVFASASLRQAVGIVILFASGIAVTGIGFTHFANTSQAIVEAMAGVRPPPNQRLVLNIEGNFICFGFPVLVVAFIHYCILQSKRSTTTMTVPNARPMRIGAFGTGVLAVAIASVLLWLPILYRTQGEQLLAHEVRNELRAGNTIIALDIMSAHPPDDFPPHWDAPPKLGLSPDRFQLLSILDTLRDHPAAPWVHAAYVAKLEQLMTDGFFLNPVVPSLTS
jgi:hypothetical protein